MWVWVLAMQRGSGKQGSAAVLPLVEKLQR